MLRMWAWKTGKSSVRQEPQQVTEELRLPHVPPDPVIPNPRVIYHLQLKLKPEADFSDSP